jgi:energy-coupling factor transport system permease protein
MLCFATHQAFLLTSFIFLVLSSCWIARLDLRRFLPITKAVVSLAVGVILIQSIFFDGNAPLFRIGPLGFHEQGAWIGIVVTLRLYCIVLTFLQFLMWTHPTDLALVLVGLRLPYRYAILAGITLRFFPILEEELGNIMAAQEARGLELRNPIRRALNILPIAVPFCLRTLRRANEVALAMELRGYGYCDQRTFLRSIRFRAADFAITAGLIASLITFLATGICFPNLL